jgi:hypothetical protein
LKKEEEQELERGGGMGKGGTPDLADWEEGEIDIY